MIPVRVRMDTKPVIGPSPDVLACTLGMGPQAGGTRCGRAPAVPIRAICVHEHIEEAVICGTHRALPQYCEPCAAAGCFWCRMSVMA
jgi:hypothetical protein